MNRFLKVILVACLACLLLAMTGCGTMVQYRDRYVTMTPNDSLLQDYEVPAPPVTAKDFSTKSEDEKESLWTQYTTDLLIVIKKHMSDKAGLRKSKEELDRQVEKLNKDVDKK